MNRNQFAHSLSQVTSTFVASVAYAFAAVALVAPAAFGQSIQSSVTVHEELLVDIDGASGSIPVGTDVSAGDADEVSSATAWAQAASAPRGTQGIRVTLNAFSSLGPAASHRAGISGVRRWTLSAVQPVHGNLEIRSSTLSNLDFSGGGVSHRINVGADATTEFDSFLSATGSASLPVSFGPGTLTIDIDSEALIWGAGSLFGEVEIDFVIDAQSTPLVETLGVGCSGANGRPVFAAAAGSFPQIAKVITLDADGLSSSGIGFALLGVDAGQWDGVPLPLDLTAVGMFGCALHHDIVLTIPLGVSASGSATLPLSIPDEPGLVGSRFYASALSFDRAANPLGVILSNALSVRVGR